MATAATACQAQPPYERVHPATLTLVIGSNGCSGTAVARRVILTASHCVTPDTKQLTANGELCEVRKQYHDGFDHVLLRVTGCHFMQTAKMGKAPKVGDRIFVWGNPSRFSDILRFGAVAGYADSGYPAMGKAQLHDFNGWNGDSGGAIFSSESGLIVAIVSVGSNPYRLMGSFPIKFTKAQWREAGV